MELSELKRNASYLLAVLGNGTRVAKHQSCPFHNRDRKGDSFSVWQDESGIFVWKCNSQGCGSGTILDAAMKVHGVQSFQDALIALEKQLGIKLVRDEDFAEPILNRDRAEAFVKDAHAHLMNSPDLQSKYMIERRGIFNLEVIERYRVGFVTPDDAKHNALYGQGFRIKGKNWSPFGWILPVTNAAGVLVAVKLHTERPLFAWAPSKSPKCVWLPFGTYPASEPKHRSNTLWPAPENFSGAAKLYVCPGELKALAMIGAGMAATSPTAGESALRPELVRRIINAKPEKAFVVADVDAPRMVAGKLERTGEKWKDGVVKALKSAGVLCYSFSFGKEIKNAARQDSIHPGNSSEEVKPTVPKRQDVAPKNATKAIAHKANALESHAGNNRDDEVRWSAGDLEAISWFKSTPNRFHPKIPFELNPGSTIDNPSFYDGLWKSISIPREQLADDVANALIRHIKRLQELCECPF